MNFPKDLKDIEKQLQDIDKIDSKQAFWIIDNKIYVYLSNSFRNRLRDPKFIKEIQKDPLQLYKTLRNVQYGFNKYNAMSGSGKDGVYMISLNKNYDNNMVKLLSKYVIDTNEYPFLNTNDKIPIRIVAHPNGIRIRPIGYIFEKNNEQHIVLVEIAIDKI